MWRDYKRRGSSWSYNNKFLENLLFNLSLIHYTPLKYWTSHTSSKCKTKSIHKSSLHKAKSSKGSPSKSSQPCPSSRLPANWTPALHAVIHAWACPSHLLPSKAVLSRILEKSCYRGPQNHRIQTPHSFSPYSVQGPSQSHSAPLWRPPRSHMPLKASLAPLDKHLSSKSPTTMDPDPVLTYTPNKSIWRRRFKLMTALLFSIKIRLLFFKICKTSNWEPVLVCLSLI